MYKHQKARSALAFGRAIAVSALAIFAGNTAHAAITAEQDAHIRSVFESDLIGAKVQEIRKTPVSGIVSVEVEDGSTVYTTMDASFFFVGDLYQRESGAIVNLSKIRLQQIAKKIIDTTPESTMIVYPAPNQKTVITVLTDVDCPYCQKLHADIASLSELGVTVRYMAFARMGVDSETGEKMQSVWCSNDQKAEMDRAMMRLDVENRQCGQNPIAMHYAAAQSIKASGTPTIIMQDGFLMPGYNAPEAIAELAIQHN